MCNLKTNLWKHLLIRTSGLRSILLTVLEFLVPVCIFLLITYTRSQIHFDKQYVNHSTYVDPITKYDLLTKISVGSTQILFAPNNQFTSKLVREIQLKLHLYNEDIHPFISITELIRYYNNYHYEGSTVAILFSNVNHSVPTQLDYEIKIFEEGVIWDTDRLFSSDFIYVPGRGSENYIDKAFAAVQIALETSFIEIVSKSPLNVSLTFQEFPYPPYLNTDGVTTIFRHVLPFLTIISFIFICPITLKRIVLEKSSGLKELLKISGVKSWILWTGWFINGIAINAISVIIIAAVVTSKLFNVEYALIEHCPFLILALFLLTYCTATTTFLFAFSTIFNRGTLAMVFGVLLWIISYIVFIGFAANIEIMSVSIKGLFLLFPTIALYYGYNTISMYEMRDADITFANLFRSPTGSADDLSLGFIIIMLIIDTCLYFCLTLYLDKIWPGPYGISKPWYFIFDKPLKLFGRNIVSENNSNDYLLKNCEESNLKPALRMKNVVKHYENTVAVNNLTIDIYEGTITSLLGENGAGKSTTMSMLIGLTKATSGDIFIGKHSIRNNVNEARKKVSICTQHDLLYDELNVQEHLRLFGMLKGLSCRQAREQAEDLLENVLKMSEKAKDYVHSLSGGMKRKLSLGIALMGDPEILILDEPTSGIDIEGRREIWNLIMTFKEKKTVLISTHFLEEAEFLSDYIAIMDNGRLLCYGTPMHLKSLYNVGYNCTINCGDDISKKNEVKNIASEYVSRDAITDKGDSFIRCYFDNESRSEVPKMLKKLQNKNIPYKLASTTLEDVYLKVQGREKPSSNKVDGPDRESITSTDSILRSGFSNVYKYLIKRGVFMRRKWRQYLSMMILCYLTIFLTFILAESGYKDISKDGKKLMLKLNTYGMTDVYYSISGVDEETSLEMYYKDIVTSEKSSPHKVESVSDTIIAEGMENIAHYNKRMVIATEFVFENNDLSAVNLMHSNNALHGAPISINVVMNALLKYFGGEEYSISASNTPLHSTEDKDQAFSQSEANNIFLWLTLLPIGPLLLVSTVLLLPTIENAKSIRVLENLCGITPYRYWLLNYLFDLILYVFVILILCLILTPTSYFSQENNAAAVWTFFVILALYGVMCIPFAYFFTFTSTVENAYSKFLVTHILVAPIIGGVLTVLELIAKYDSIAQWKYAVFLLNPHVLLCYILANFSRKIVQNHNWDIMPEQGKKFLCFESPLPCCLPESDECAAYKAYVNEQRNVLILIAIATAAYLLILMIREQGFEWLSRTFTCAVDKLKNGNNESTSQNDSQNTDETDQGNNQIISVNNIQKMYWVRLRLKTAVKKLTFSLKKGDCYGLLGVNGAGKSTSFRILTNQLLPTYGKFKFDKKTMGYCPQHDALIDDLTGRDLLNLFARFRNINNRDHIVNQLLDKFGLTKIADKPCGTYSGGNKRKLSTAISFIGSPNCILLDEPTSGVDPVSRRELWDLIEQIKAEKETGIILTSHSMDECEALCDRLCILKEGEIKTQGSIEDLKKKFCIGHVVKVKFDNSATEKDENEFIDDLRKIFVKENQIVRLGKHNALLHIRIIESTWPDILKTMEELRKEKKHCVVDYWAKEASLEEVFLQVAQDNSKDVNQDINSIAQIV